MDNSEMGMDDMINAEMRDPNARGSTDPPPVSEVLHLKSSTKSVYRLLTGPVMVRSVSANPQALRSRVEPIEHWNDIKYSTFFIFRFANPAAVDALLSLMREREYVTYGASILELPNNTYKCTAMRKTQGTFEKQTCDH